MHCSLYRFHTKEFSNLEWMADGESKITKKCGFEPKLLLMRNNEAIEILEGDASRALNWLLALNGGH